MDMMGASDLSSSETTQKLHGGIADDFYAMVAGPFHAAREMATCCLKKLKEQPPANFADVLAQVRSGLASISTRNNSVTGMACWAMRPRIRQIG
jgi:hypothetical protein